MCRAEQLYALVASSVDTSSASGIKKTRPRRVLHYLHISRPYLMEKPLFSCESYWELGSMQKGAMPQVNKESVNSLIDYNLRTIHQ